MRKTLPGFESAIDEGKSVWRYSDLPKFLSVLQRKALYFCRADLLGDPLEGSFTAETLTDRKRWPSRAPGRMSKERKEYVMRCNNAMAAKADKHAYVNCWHLGEHESMAMWAGYGGGSFGIAIRSTFGGLAQALPETFALPETSDAFARQNIYLAPVSYLDYRPGADKSPDGDILGKFFCKSMPYSHEAELRAVFRDGFGICGETDGTSGYNVPTNLERLVDAVVVSPLAPPWFESVVLLTCERFGYQFKVYRSGARDRPPG